MNSDKNLDLLNQNEGPKLGRQEFLGILMGPGIASDFAMDCSLVHHVASGMGGTLLMEPYSSGLAEDSCHHSSLVQLNRQSLKHGPDEILQ
jgi:hypothetical protein